MPTALYDVKRKTVTRADGVATENYAAIETRKFEVQPIRFSSERSSTIVTIDIGGESYIPSFIGFTDIESIVTATDRITANSGTLDLFVLRTYEFEDHQELDLREVED